MAINLYDILQDVLNESAYKSKVSVENRIKQVIRAIKNKRQVLITYDDEQYHRVGTRACEIYAYGTTMKGEPIIRVFQPYGDTYRGVPNWKTMLVKRIKTLKSTKQSFNDEPKDRGYNVEPFNRTGDKSMAHVEMLVDLGNNTPLSGEDTLDAARRKTKELQNSNPTNIKDFMTKQHNGSVTNKVAKDISKGNDSRFSDTSINNQRGAINTNTNNYENDYELARQEADKQNKLNYQNNQYDDYNDDLDDDEINDILNSYRNNGRR